MAKTDTFYTKEEVLLELPKGRDTIRLMIGHKNLRGEPKTYLDLRVWYLDEDDNLLPGKGFAKPLNTTEMTLIAENILKYVDGIDNGSNI